MLDRSNPMRPDAVGERQLAGKFVGLLLSATLTLGLLLVAEWLIGWGRLLATWQKVSWTQLILPTLLVLASYALRGLRLRSWFGPLAWRPLVQLVLLHNFWNNILPMRFGEVSFPLLLQRNFGIELAPATLALIWFRVLDLACLLLIFSLAWVWALMPILLPLPLALLVMLVYLMHKNLPRFRHQPLFQRHAFLVQLVAGAELGRLIQTFIWTLLNWLVKLIAFGLVITLFLQQAVDGAARLSLLEGVLGAIGGEVTSVLPIHGFAGAGSYEAGVLLFLQLTSLSLEAALAAGIYLHLFLLSITLVTGTFALLLYEKK